MFKSLLLLLCLPLLGFSQKPSKGRIIYSVEANEMAKSGADSRLISNLYDGLDEIKLELIFYDNISRFSVLEDKKQKNNRVSRMAKKVVCPGTFYTDRMEKDVYKNVRINGEETSVISKTDKIHWKLTDSTRLIKGYTCYLALATYSNAKSAFNQGGFTIEAWYSEKIPIPLGPRDFGNLPGLILELDAVLFVYRATSIELGVDIGELKIPVLPKKLLEDDYNLYLKNTMGRNK